MNYPKLPHQLSRRQTLQLLGLSGMGYLLGSCSDAELAGKIGDLSEPLNQSVEQLLVTPQQLIPKFPVSSIDPKALIINTYDFTPQIDPAEYRLIVDGEVKFPIELKLSALKLSKWVTKVTFTSQISISDKGDWEEQGYEWCGGI